MSVTDLAHSDIECPHTDCKLPLVVAKLIGDIQWIKRMLWLILGSTGSLVAALISKGFFNGG